jgi:hypothetical protein
LIGHTVETAFELGWATLKNGELLSAAESAGFEVFLTTDKSLKYQQNLTARTISIVVLSTTSWPRIQRAASKVIDVVNSVVAGGYAEIAVD